MKKSVAVVMVALAIMVGAFAIVGSPVAVNEFAGTSGELIAYSLADVLVSS